MEHHATRARQRAGGGIVLGLLTALLLAQVASLPSSGPDRNPLALRPPTVHRTADGTRIACSVPDDCVVLATALALAGDALDPVLPSVAGLSAVTVVAPTTAGQLAIVGARIGGAPAATTLLVGDDMVRRRVAAPQDRGRVWIVVNPAVTAGGADRAAEVLVHELVHVRTRAADLPGPLWVEEGYAVALTARALGAAAVAPRDVRGAVPDTGTVPDLPADDWAPSTLEDYALAAGIVESLADSLGWEGVTRWYAATSTGRTPRAAAVRRVHHQATGGPSDHS